jgi:hypothetical protein
LLLGKIAEILLLANVIGSLLLKMLGLNWPASIQ